MTAALVLLASLFCLVYIGPWSALAFLTAGVWGLVNIYFLAATVRSAVSPGEIDKLNVAGLAIIKFPLLYVAGYFTLSFERFEIPYLFAGMSVFFVVIVLKTVARALLKLDDSESAPKRQSVLE